MSSQRPLKPILIQALIGVKKDGKNYDSALRKCCSSRKIHAPVKAGPSQN
jgi:hypothetical protein